MDLFKDIIYGNFISIKPLFIGIIGDYHRFMYRAYRLFKIPWDDLINKLFRWGIEWQHLQKHSAVQRNDGAYKCINSSCQTRKVEITVSVCVCVPMPTHCTITCFGFHARWIDAIKCGLFFNHAPLGQTTLCVGWVSA